MSAPDPDRLARDVLRRGGFARVVRGRVRGSRSDTTPCPGSKKAEEQLCALRRAMDEVFSCDTAFGTCKDDRPSAGHCMLAAMVVQDLCGGRILAAEVGGIPHYWNRVTTASGEPLEVDLTGDQFAGRAKVQVGCAPLYPNDKTVVFARDPGESLIPEVNQEILALHQTFVRRLAPLLGKDARRVFGSALRRVAPEPVAPEPVRFLYLRVRNPKPDDWHWFIQKIGQDKVLAVRIGDGYLRAIPIIAFVDDLRQRKKKVTPRPGRHRGRQFGSAFETDVYDERTDVLFFMDDSDVGPKLVRLAHDFFRKGGSALRRVAPETPKRDPKLTWLYVSRPVRDPNDEPLFWSVVDGWVPRSDDATGFTSDEIDTMSGPSTDGRGRAASILSWGDALALEEAWIDRLHGGSRAGSALRRVAPRQVRRKDQMPTTPVDEVDANEGYLVGRGGRGRHRVVPYLFRIAFPYGTHWEREDEAWAKHAPTAWRALWETVVEECGVRVIVKTKAFEGPDTRLVGEVDVEPLPQRPDLIRVTMTFDAFDEERDKEWSDSDTLVVPATEEGFDAMMERVTDVGYESVRRVRGSAAGRIR